MNEDTSFYKNLLDNLHDGVYFVDKDIRITYWNSAAEKITGYSLQEILNTRCPDNRLQHIDQKGKKLCKEGCPLHETLKDGQPREVENLFLYHKDGHRVPISIKISPIRNADGEIIGAVEIFFEHSAKLEIEKHLKYLEKRLSLDSLTRLPNRAYLEDLIPAKILEFERTGSQFGLVFIDVDNFKSINDTYGHDMGDRVLRLIKETLVKNIRVIDTACRWGGDEFVVLLSDMKPETMAGVADKFLTLVRHSGLKVDHDLLQVTISIGATLIEPGDTLQSLVKRADSLMYESKKTGKDRVTIG